MKKNMFKRKHLIVAILILVIIFAVPNVGNAIDVMQRQLDLFQEVYELVSTYHINDVDPEKLTQGAIDGMLNTLDDPYTTYFTEEEYQAFLQSVDNKFVGIGIYIDDSSDYIKVQTAIPNSPAAKAELKAGDMIVEVDGIDIKGKRTEEVAGLIRGPQGTSVNLKIKRGEEYLTKVIIRDEIQLPETDATMLQGNVGYIRLYSFGSMSSFEFNQHLKDLEEKNMEGLILDLRGNPGGYLGAATEIAKNFIKDAPIAYLIDKNQETQEINIEGGNVFNKPLVVLIDHGSASASEILAGALKDYGIAKLIGQKSFGKGTVQHLLNLENGGYLKLTFNEYYTPLNHKVNGVGIQPDIVVDDPDELLIRAIEEITTKAIYHPTKGSSWVTIDGREMIALRPLVDFFDGDIYWNGELKAVELEIKDDKYTFSIDSESIKIMNGVTYVDLELLKKEMSNLIVIEKRGKLELLYK